MAKRRLRKVPGLNELELKQAIAQIDSSTNISRSGKRALKLIVQAASNKNAEKLDVIIAGLPDDRKMTVEKGAQWVQEAGANQRKRAATALLDMSDEEWEKLVRSTEDG